MEESFEKRLEENNFKQIELNFFNSEPHMHLNLSIPIDSKDGQIRLKFGNDQIISVPGTLDENVRFLLWPIWKRPEDDLEYYVDDYVLYEADNYCCQEFVPAAAWTDEEQIIDVKRFITDKAGKCT